MARILIFSFLVLIQPGMVIGDCRQDVQVKEGFEECMNEFQTFTTKVSPNPERLNDPAYMTGFLCTGEAKSAFRCFMSYIKDCPEMISPPGASGNGSESGGGLEQLMGLIGADGVDIYCAMNSGPCSAFKECFPEGTSNNAPMRKKRQTMVEGGRHIYQMLHEQAQMLCTESEMKTTIMCLDNSIKKCDSDVVPKIEKYISNILDSLGMFTSHEDFFGTITFEKAKNFIKERCKSMPAGFERSRCYSNNYDELFTCFDKVTDTFPKLDTCNTITQSDACVTKYIEPDCGEDVAEFFTSNDDYMFPKVPAECFPTTASASTILGTLSMILVPLLVTLFA